MTRSSSVSSADPFPVVFDPFLRNDDHTDLGLLLLNLTAGDSLGKARNMPPGGGGRARRRGHMRGESRLGAAPPRGAVAWATAAAGGGSPSAVRARARQGH